jgi:hypothetical protein
MAALVTAAHADQIERALADGEESALAFDAEDGRYTVMLRRVVYLKRFARVSGVGFGG